MVDNASRGQALDTNSRGHGSPYDRGAVHAWLWLGDDSQRAVLGLDRGAQTF